jgi:hypothetical protein
MEARNYKHKHGVRFANIKLADNLTIPLVLERVNQSRIWLKRIPKGQDWTYSREEVEYKVRNVSVRAPLGVFFDKKEDAVAFKLAFGIFDSDEECI